MEATLGQTPLHSWHVAHGGRMVDFAGWSMPVQYTSIIAEHNTTRQHAGLFDVSHMGRLLLCGPEVAKFVDSLVTRRVLHLAEGAIRYALVINEKGGILDDVLVYNLGKQENSSDLCYQLVVNAGNREKIVRWIRSHLPDSGVTLEDHTEQTAMIAVQGPQALEILAKLVDTDLTKLKYYTGTKASIAGAPGFVSRTGYTGEDGCEWIVAAEDAQDIWTKILQAGESFGVTAAGLACRDTLRLEAGMPLYGHELTEEISPVQAGLCFACNVENRDFLGRQAIISDQQNPQLPQRIGLKLFGKRVPRQHYPILLGDQTVGEITSGTFSPTFNKPIAMGYVQSDCADVGQELTVDIRGRAEKAKIVPLPFYTRKN